MCRFILGFLCFFHRVSLGLPVLSGPLAFVSLCGGHLLNDFEQLDLLLQARSEGMDGTADWPPPQEKEV